MRTAVAVATILAAALAGCGQRQENVQNTGLPTPGPRPANTMSADLSSEQAFRQGFRSMGIETCISAARNRAAQSGGQPPGTDFRPACTCYIDRVMAGLSQRQLASLRPGPREQAIVEQCGREHGLIQDGGGK
jgi:hypothetical protein